MDRERMTLAGIAMVVVGFFVVLAGTLTSPGGSSGGFILIGPFPIVFGNGPNSGTLAVVGGVITAVLVAFYIMTFLMMRKDAGHLEDSVPNT